MREAEVEETPSSLCSASTALVSGDETESRVIEGAVIL